MCSRSLEARASVTVSVHEVALGDDGADLLEHDQMSEVAPLTMTVSLNGVEAQEQL